MYTLRAEEVAREKLRKGKLTVEEYEQVVVLVDARRRNEERLLAHADKSRHNRKVQGQVPAQVPVDQIKPDRKIDRKHDRKLPKDVAMDKLKAGKLTQVT